MGEIGGANDIPLCPQHCLCCRLPSDSPLPSPHDRDVAGITTPTNAGVCPAAIPRAVAVLVEVPGTGRLPVHTDLGRPSAVPVPNDRNVARISTPTDHDISAGAGPIPRAVAVIVEEAMCRSTAGTPQSSWYPSRSNPQPPECRSHPRPKK